MTTTESVPPTGSPRDDLILERRDQQDKTVHIAGMSITPLIDKGYWAYRVRLSERQAVVGFPKFGTVGIGFSAEEDWNTNLPFTTETDEIVAHILHNKGDDAISDADVHLAVAMVQDAAWGDHGPAKLLDVIARMADDPAYIHCDWAVRVIAAMVERTGWTR